MVTMVKVGFGLVRLTRDTVSHPVHTNQRIKHYPAMCKAYPSMRKRSKLLVDVASNAACILVILCNVSD